MAGSNDVNQPGGLVAATVDQLLLSLAEGVVTAQAALNRLQTVDRLGHPEPAYFLPRLDFELRVTTEFVQSSTSAPGLPVAAQSFLREAPGARRQLVLRPVQAAETAAPGFKAEVISTIRGSLVAVPPNDGKPALVVTLSLPQKTGRRYDLAVRVSTVIGEPVAGLEVHFNVDATLSRDLSVSDIPAFGSPKRDTVIENAVIKTDSQGRAFTALVLAPDEIPGAQIAVLVDVAGKTERIVVTVPRT